MNPKKAKDGEYYRFVRREDGEVVYYVLQRKNTSIWAILKNLSLWEDIEKELVPTFAIIAKNLLGGTSWRSTLIEKWENL